MRRIVLDDVHEENRCAEVVFEAQVQLSVRETLFDEGVALEVVPRDARGHQPLRVGFEVGHLPVRRDHVLRGNPRRDGRQESERQDERMKPSQTLFARPLPSVGVGGDVVAPRGRITDRPHRLLRVVLVVRHARCIEPLAALRAVSSDRPFRSPRRGRSIRGLRAPRTCRSSAP